MAAQPPPAPPDPLTCEPPAEPSYTPDLATQNEPSELTGS
jgi:hypothetical protein